MRSFYTGYIVFNFNLVGDADITLKISLKTITGVIILEKELEGIDTFVFGSDLESGIYLLEVLSQEEAQVFKLVKK